MYNLTMHCQNTFMNFDFSIKIRTRPIKINGVITSQRATVLPSVGQKAEAEAQLLWFMHGVLVYTESYECNHATSDHTNHPCLICRRAQAHVR